MSEIEKREDVYEGEYTKGVRAMLDANGIGYTVQDYASGNVTTIDIFNGYHVEYIEAVVTSEFVEDYHFTKLEFGKKYRGDVEVDAEFVANMLGLDQEVERQDG